MAPNSNPVVVLDNGAHTIKAGLSTLPASNARVIPNAAIRSKGDKQLYIGHEFEKCWDYASLNYRLSFERGYLTDWDVQKAVWDNLFSKDALSLDLPSSSLLITEPPFNFNIVQEKYDQLVFEEYEFASYLRTPAASLAPYGSLFSTSRSSQNLPYPECSIIVDSGFSFTHVIPLMQGNIVWSGVRRIDVGGKLLTNHLSTLVSFRQWNMLDQTYIVNDVKEKCCYVTSSFSEDLERCRVNGANDITLQYVLPDFSRNRHGFVLDNPVSAPTPSAKTETMFIGIEEEIAPYSPAASPVREEALVQPESDQILYMSNERFSVPELIFNPSDIGLSQGGLPQVVAHSISSLPPDLQGMFWANVGLIGGNVKFPGFGARLQQELRALAPMEYEVGVYESEDPILETYKAAHSVANSDTFPLLAVTREEYNEGGSNACRRKFRAFDWNPIKEKTPQVPRPQRKESSKLETKSMDNTDDSESVDEGKKPKKAPPKKKITAQTSRPRPVTRRK